MLVGEYLPFDGHNFKNQEERVRAEYIILLLLVHAVCKPAQYISHAHSQRERHLRGDDENSVMDAAHEDEWLKLKLEPLPG